jgi:hypothetical protein
MVLWLTVAWMPRFSGRDPLSIFGWAGNWPLIWECAVVTIFFWCLLLSLGNWLREIQLQGSACVCTLGEGELLVNPEVEHPSAVRLGGGEPAG